MTMTKEPQLSNHAEDLSESERVCLDCDGACYGDDGEPCEWCGGSGIEPT